MRRLILASAVLTAMASAAAAQTSGAAPSSIIYGGGVSLNGLAVPNARSTGACTADNSCASFPLTPLGAADPSLGPRLAPTTGAANQTGSALTAPPLVATPNPTGAINPGAALARPGVGTIPNQTGGVDQTGGINRTSGALANPAAGTPATRAPAMSSNAFQAQCANSTDCGAFQGQ